MTRLETILRARRPQPAVEVDARWAASYLGAPVDTEVQSWTLGTVPSSAAANPDQIVTAIETAMQKVREDTAYTVCVGSERHVVHPLDYERGGWAPCGGCGTAVWLGEPATQEPTDGNVQS